MTDKMQLLHSKLLEQLLDRLEHGEKVLLKDGTMEIIPCPAATLNVIRQFLKDNRIETLDAASTDQLEKLNALLPFTSMKPTKHEFS